MVLLQVYISQPGSVAVVKKRCSLTCILMRIQAAASQACETLSLHRWCQERVQPGIRADTPGALHKIASYIWNSVIESTLLKIQIFDSCIDFQSFRKLSCIRQDNTMAIFQFLKWSKMRWIHWKYLIKSSCCGCLGFINCIFYVKGPSVRTCLWKSVILLLKNK